MIGSTIDQIDTPALLLDMEVFEANLKKMSDFMAGREANLRPHVKTHKCSEVARRQIALGARGLTCAKLGEAEAMADAGLSDLLIANQVVGRVKIRRLVELARRCEVIVALDDERNCNEIDAAARAAGVNIGVLLEINTGMNRCGVEAGEATLALARLGVQSEGLRFRGIMGYEGHAVMIKDPAERRSVCEESLRILVSERDRLQSAGIPVEIVSAGGTGTYDITAGFPGITEIQAGSYCMMDVRYHDDVGIDFPKALSVLATVVSRPSDKVIFLDSGKKVLTEEFGLPKVKTRSDVKLTALSEEHGRLDVLGASCGLKPGDKVELYPSHCCTTINLHDEYVCVRGGTVDGVWRIDARGRSK